MTPLPTGDRAPLYRRILGEAWDSLPEPLQVMHDVTSERTADGVAVVERGSGLLARLVAFVIGLPPAGADIPITVSFRARRGREYWQRNFAGRAFASVQEQGRGRFERLVCERFGPLNVGMALVCESERLRFVVRRWCVWGVPLPRALAPRGDSYEFAEAGRFHFHVEIAHPFTGLIVRYRGWLIPQA
ncbi:MAG: hypothetical protein QOJ58_1066 [Alphaproteobacteria bacterium]|jgi:hypothetical protein|nr:hypothetical protein [Alphaproteobacteria bacterium]